MCYTRAEHGDLYQDEPKPAEQPRELETRQIDEVKRYEHLPSSLPIDPAFREEPTLAPAS